MTNKALLAYPNSGESFDAVKKDWNNDPISESFGEEARKWYDAGARLIGGCCRSTPEDIRGDRGVGKSPVIARSIADEAIPYYRVGDCHAAFASLKTAARNDDNWRASMKSIRMVETGKPLQLQEIPIPNIGEKDVLVRVRAAGICHSDAHYRAGRSSMGMMPITLGHEIAGIVEKVGSQVMNVKVGDRVCLHYNITCGDCTWCSTGNEQFCESVKMLGHHVDGGYAETIAVPARNAIPLPDEISFEEGATLMCASATAFHALHKGRVKAGERVAVFGVGGLGMSAIQLAKAMGAVEVYAVDIQQDKLELASEYNAIPIDASRCGCRRRNPQVDERQGRGCCARNDRHP